MATAGRSGSSPDYEVVWPPGSGIACVDLLAPAAGGIDDRLRAELAALADQEPLLVDLGHAEPIDAACVRRLVSAITRGRTGRLALVCPGPEARQALRAIGVERVAPIFASRADALQARALQLAGFGQGWLPGPLRSTARTRSGHSPR